jgi:chromosome segregation protein
MGAVNLKAGEEAEIARTCLSTLEAERLDLEEASAKLQAAVADLNEEGRQRLRAAFTAVEARFAHLFKQLFQGGEAHLELIEGADPLDAGLDIKARPPGKRMGPLSLMSGGEQALTAIALIFAVFEANPSPVCVLDEVDAPLDDANVDRFCTLLEAMARESQTRFLIVTHHALTMSRVDRLFGVTMAERGVSRLVSVDLHHASAMAAE